MTDISVKHKQFESCINLIRQQFNRHFYASGMKGKDFEELFQEVLFRCWKKFLRHDASKGACHTTYLRKAAILATAATIKTKRGGINRRFWQSDVYAGGMTNELLTTVKLDHRHPTTDTVDRLDAVNYIRNLIGEEDFALLDWHTNGYWCGEEPPACYRPPARGGPISSQSNNLRIRIRRLIRDKGLQPT
jgi:hypothetical protein